MKKVIIRIMVIGWKSRRIKEERANLVAINRVLSTYTIRIATITSSSIVEMLTRWHRCRMEGQILSIKTIEIEFRAP